MNSKLTSCINCEYLFKKLLFFSHNLCKAHPIEKTINPVTGKYRKIFPFKAFKKCKDVNTHMNCKFFKRK